MWPPRLSEVDARQEKVFTSNFQRLRIQLCSVAVQCDWRTTGASSVTGNWSFFFRNRSLLIGRSVTVIKSETDSNVAVLHSDPEECAAVALAASACSLTSSPWERGGFHPSTRQTMRHRSHCLCTDLTGRLLRCSSQTKSGVAARATGCSTHRYFLYC